MIQVKSVNLAKSVMWDWTHLICENICPNMFELWSGQFKGLNSRHFDYVIQEKVWIEIGNETVNAVQHIPAAFIRVLGNITQD